MPNRVRKLSELENLIGYKFKDKSLLELALTHKSYARVKRKPDNERLEFLGDAVLQLVVSQYLYKSYPDDSEGKLAKIRALFVSQPTLAQQARKIKLNEFLKVGKGEERTGARMRDSLLCDTLEAFYGAIYLDSGLQVVKPIILNHIPDLAINNLSIIDAKSTLQEHLQQTNRATPIYHLTEEHGPDHEKLFVVEVCFQNERLGRGKGRSKKEAAQAAAREALNALDVNVTHKKNKR